MMLGLNQSITNCNVFLSLTGPHFFSVSTASISLKIATYEHPVMLAIPCNQTIFPINQNANTQQSFLIAEHLIRSKIVVFVD